MANEEWHLSKSVPITLIFVIFVQSATAIWWASSITSKVDSIIIKQAQTDRDLAAENLRQWSRINDGEREIDLVQRDNAVIQGVLDRMGNDIKGIEGEVKELNSLLREYFRNRGGPRRTNSEEN